MTVLVTDTCVILNFAIVHELDVLRTGLASRRAQCTQAVQAELQSWTSTYPGLSALIEDEWLGVPIELNGDADRTGVERFRRHLGGTSARPLEHLGEAESIHALKTRPGLVGAVLLTEDRSAVHLAGIQRLPVWDTFRFLSSMYADGDVTWPRARDMLDHMYEAERGVRLPVDEQDFARG